LNGTLKLKFYYFFGISNKKALVRMQIFNTLFKKLLSNS
jgi:hypothetical protein